MSNKMNEKEFYKVPDEPKKDYRVTPDMLEAVIAKEEYTKLGTKMTACILTLENGHEVVGMAGVVDASKYDITIGAKYAREKAVEQLWPLLGYIKQIEMWEDTKHIIEEDIIIDDDAMKHRVVYPTLHESRHEPEDIKTDKEREQEHMGWGPTEG